MMSFNLRTAVAWLLSVAVLTALAPTALAAERGGRGPHGGGGSHGGSHVSKGIDNRGGGQMQRHSGGSTHVWKGTPHIASKPIVPNRVQSQPFVKHGENWKSRNFERHGDWNHHNAFVFEHRRDWDDWWRFGLRTPFLGYGWRPGYYGYGYSTPYIGGAYDYGYDVGPYTAYEPEVAETATPAEIETPMVAEDETGDSYSQALAAFRQGDYGNATRMAAHAAIDDPKNPDVHLLLSLGLFAGGEYRGAASEAHAVATLGKVPDWSKVMGMYGNNVDPYTTQLRALEKFVRGNPTAPEGRFLLGFQYTIADHKKPAQDQFMEALKLTPRDKLTAQLLTKVGGTVPADIAKQQAESGSIRR